MPIHRHHEQAGFDASQIRGEILSAIRRNDGDSVSSVESGVKPCMRESLGHSVELASGPLCAVSVYYGDGIGFAINEILEVAFRWHCYRYAVSARTRLFVRQNLLNRDTCAGCTIIRARAACTFFGFGKENALLWLTAIVETVGVMTCASNAGLRSRFGAIAESLQARLDIAFRGIERRHTAVAMSVDGDCYYAMSSRRPVPGIGSSTFLTGCLTKLFTAALVEDAIERRLVSRDTLVQEAVQSCAPALRGTTVGQLVEHTHGLERFVAVSRRGRDCTDTQAFLASLVRHAEPGDLYSYSSLGARISAAMLESLVGMRFVGLLRGMLFCPLGMSSVLHGGTLVPEEGICPAIGGSLAMSVDDMLRFLVGWVLPRASTWPRTEGGTTKLPGWSALERGVYRGWKFYGEGWYGHNSIWPHASASVRIQPRARIALLITSREQPVTAVVARLFGKILPEYRNLRIPKAVPWRESPDRLCSQYGCGEPVAIECRGAKQLRLRGPRFASELEPAEHDVFFARPLEDPRYAFVQPLRPGRRGYEYLWNGQRILKRTRASS